MTTVLLCLVVLGAFFTEAVAGFGATVLTVAFGASLVPLDVLLPAFVPINLVVSVVIVIRHRDAIEWSLLLRRIVPFMLVGFPVGLVVFRTFAGEQERAMKLAFGAVISTLATLELIRLARRRPPAGPLPRAAEIALLATGGAIHGAWSSGGPLVVYVLNRSGLDKRRFRSTLSMLWLGLGTLLVVAYVQGGALDARTLRLSALFAPMMLLGLVLGERAHDRVPAGAFRGVVTGLLLAGGLLLVAKHLG